jgi:hypothetical protein
LETLSYLLCTNLCSSLLILFLFVDQASIQNVINTTRIFVNPDIPEAHQFKDRFVAWLKFTIYLYFKIRCLFVVWMVCFKYINYSSILALLFMGLSWIPMYL